MLGCGLRMRLHRRDDFDFTLDSIEQVASKADTQADVLVVVGFLKDLAMSAEVSSELAVPGMKLDFCFDVPVTEG